MSLFQKSVLIKYQNLQDKNAIEKAFKKYVKYFHNPEIQQNIRESKEEQYQEGFLRELFVNILNYTINPNPNFNLTTELKNEKGAKKVDGAILSHDSTRGLNPLKKRNVIAVIELKGTKTKDLESIRQQAFDYKANQSNCVYVITSNFEKLRFYIQNAVNFEEFNLFTLNKEQFELLYICLQKDNLLQDIPLKIKTDSLVKEEKITKDFYNDYSLFKRELFRDLVKRNMKNEVFRNELQKENSDRANKNIKLLLFKKSQKLIDRFLFIFFAEDKSLLPPNSTLKILKKWQSDVDFGDERPLYNLFKQYFKFLDLGRKKTQGRAEIFAYNGGLFKPDPILDSLEIDDNLLFNHTKKLSEYDFKSQVSVNILGHIFENSLNEIESINAEIEGRNFDKQKTKRKKDGVFYTPTYITKYIVDNTVGKLCKEKKQVLKIREEDYNKSRKGRKTETIKRLKKQLDTYRNWLLQITILDPACGSGAFLNQALDFLINEHKYIDELETSLLGGKIVFQNIENTILEQNIFGVDINEESVEIAKLSLWLRTAQPRRKLNSLNNNIKCGNSLIDDPKIAGEKAFNWQEEFPQIFKEKDKKAYHITTAIHDSRTSARMKKYKVRERREMGTNPYPNIIYFTKEDDLLITETIADIVKEDKLNMLAYNICADHLHLLLVCDINEVPKIMQKIKGRTSYVHKRKQHKEEYKGLKPLAKEQHKENYKGLKSLAEKEKEKENKKPLWQQKYSAPKEVTSQEQLNNTLNYIQKNRTKHELPAHSNKIKLIIQNMCTDYITATSKKEYFGGFDVVIGNPPYVQLQKMKEVSAQIKQMNFKTYESTGDLYCLFYELGVELLTNNGLLGFITSNKWMRANYGKSLRKYFYENTTPYQLLDLGAGIFEGAVVDSNIILLKKEKTKNFIIPSLDISNETNVQDFLVYHNQFVAINPKDDDVWTISSKAAQDIKLKIEKLGTPLKDWNIEINRGILSGLTEAFIIDKNKKEELIQKNPKSAEILKPVLRGRDIKRYTIDYQDLYLINTHNGYKDVERINVDEYPAIKEHLLQFEPQLSKRGDKGKTPFNLRNCAYIDAFEKPNLFYPDISQQLSFVYSDSNYFTTNTGYFILSDDKYLLAVLNSKLINYYYKTISAQLGKTGIRAFTIYIEQIPIPKAIETKLFIEKANLLLEASESFQKNTTRFQTYLKSQFSIQKLSKKLQNWHELDFGEFIKELNKYKGLKSLAEKENKERVKAERTPIARLSKLDEMDWMEVFETKKAEAQTLKAQVDKIDKEIDKMVYKLYELTEAEIQIIENSIA